MEDFELDRTKNRIPCERYEHTIYDLGSCRFCADNTCQEKQFNTI